MAPHQPDYSLYLVTGRELLPPGADYYESLEQTLKTGKVTVVQIREKHADNGEFLEIAQKSLAICDEYSVPMLINDNLSVALCLPPRVGLHIGQEDIPLAQARKILGPDRLIGISAHTVAEAQQVLAEGIADYAGVGPVYGTQSKAGITEDKVLGPRGAADVVAALADEKSGKRIPCVLIGGINTQTCARSLAGATSTSNFPDGVAVISAIVGRRDPDVAAMELDAIIRRYQSRLNVAVEAFSSHALPSAEAMVDAAAQMLDTHRQSAKGPPLIQTITSHVSSTMSANMALAFSASPIMSHEAEEAADLGQVTGAVVLNIGTIGPDSRRGMQAVGKEANNAGKPIVLDPVGVGASSFRKNCVQAILNQTQVTLIKGNAAELSSIAGLSEVASRGVDSGSGTLKDPIGLVRSLSRKEKCLVLLTGKTDYLSDGSIVIACDNGHPLAGRITGTGCALGVLLAAGMAAACNLASSEEKENNKRASLSTLLVKGKHEDLLVGALMGLLTLTIASEVAAERDDVRGPGSFIPALIDEVARMDGATLAKRAKV